MSNDADTPARVVVLMPEVLAHAFHDAECRSVLEMWRDGRIRLGANRDLLAKYARVLRGLGIADPIVRRWMLWFTATDKSEFQGHDSESLTDCTCAAVNAANCSKATAIVGYRDRPGEFLNLTGARWITAKEFSATW